MKISTRLGLSGVLAIGALSVIAAVLLFATQQMKRELTQDEAAGEILNAVAAVRYLTLEYVAGHEERAQTQSRLRNASLSKLLSNATGSRDKEGLAALDDLRHKRQEIETLFTELVADRENVKANTGNEAVLQELEARLTGQIMSRAQDMISDALVLSESSRRGVLSAQQQVKLAVVVFSAVVLLALLATWILMLRSVIQPLATLRAGTVIIGGGNLDHRLAITTRDEIGDLSRAFDKMTETLKGTTVSRNELEQANNVLQTEIAERKRAEERFYATLELAPTGMVMVDRTGRITLVNTLTETLFGYHRDELLGQSVEILLPKRYCATHPGLRDGFFHNPSVRRMGEGRELYGLRKDGSEFPVEIGLNPIETSEGTFVLSAIADITERKRAEKKLRARTEELARSNQDLEQFAYIASHDLQEPLRGVAGPLQLLQRRYQGQLDARAHEFIGHAVDGVTRMQALIDDLLIYSRVGKQEETRRPTACGQALDHALENLTTAIQETGAQVSRGVLPTIPAIPGLLSLLFQNLVGNALKFRRKDNPVHIHVGAEPRGNAWLLWVKDNGIGIEPQYFGRIFLIFQRLHTRHDYPGTGIGLALCRRIVEHHGGRIWVESDPGKGTTFFFTLRQRFEHEMP
jgi:PAS domain S-box-containing protein